MNVYKELNSITDSLEFRNTTVPKLFELDSLLRCHICKEFLVAPMLTSCGHTFCSVCIRKYLLHTSKCPMCSKELRESNLSRNILLEQIVLTYKDLRPELLDQLHLKKDLPSKAQNETKAEQESQKESSITETSVIINLDDNEEGTNSKSNTNNISDDEIVFLQETRKRKSDFNPSLDSILKRQKSAPQKKKEMKTVEKSLNLGECPICFNKYPIEVLQSTHIDSCLSNSKSSYPSSPTPVLSSPQKTKSNFKSSMPFSEAFQAKESKNEFKKMTKLDYLSLSTSALKSKLSRLELPTHGTRFQLVARYNEYLTIWNANCDSMQPKDPRLLRKQLVQWENTLKFKVKDSGAKMEKKDWEDLIVKAKASAKKAREKQDDIADEKKEDTVT